MIIYIDKKTTNYLINRKKINITINIQIYTYLILIQYLFKIY